MATEQDKAQVFDLIQRIMKAAETDVLADETRGAQALGFEIRERVDQFKISRREIITGIPLLDRSPTKQHASYGVRNRPDFRWGVGVRSIGYLVCIRQAEIEALYGKPQRKETHVPYPGHQGDPIESYDYVTETPLGIRTATFEYILRDNGLECLHNFGVRLVPRQFPL